MIKKFKSERGITITTLVITVVLLIIITSILAKNSKTTMQLSNLTKLKNDIEILNDRVGAYYVTEGKLPILEETEFTYDKTTLTQALKDEISVNDGDTYSTIDLSKIDNATLNYGNNYLQPSTTDRYVINNETHVIYYLKGIVHDGTWYHTIGANPPVV